VRARLRPDVYGFRDAYQALGVALDGAIPRSRFPLADLVRDPVAFALRRRIDAQRRRLASAFGRLRLLEEERHLLALVEA
jgi:hypothetical protein